MEKRVSSRLVENINFSAAHCLQCFGEKENMTRLVVTCAFRRLLLHVRFSDGLFEFTVTVCAGGYRWQMLLYRDLGLCASAQKYKLELPTYAVRESIGQTHQALGGGFDDLARQQSHRTTVRALTGAGVRLLRTAFQQDYTNYQLHASTAFL